MWALDIGLEKKNLDVWVILRQKPTDNNVNHKKSQACLLFDESHAISGR